MLKFLVFMLAVVALPASAAGRECVAILLSEGTESPRCMAIDEQLENLTDSLFNDTACNLGISMFTLGDAILLRDASTKNLISDECEWEVRAPSGRR